MKEKREALTSQEYNVLNKVARKTGSDCWFLLEQDCRGEVYVYDIENGLRMCLKTAVGQLAEALDCQENFDNCCLKYAERLTLSNLFAKLNISLDPVIDWKL